METGILQAKTEEIQRTCAVWISKVVCNQWNRVLLLSKQEKICGSRLNAVGRRLSPCEGEPHARFEVAGDGNGLPRHRLTLP